MLTSPVAESSHSRLLNPAVDRSAPQPRREIRHTRIAILLSCATSLVAIGALVHVSYDRFVTGHATLAAIEAFFAINFTFLMFRIISYQFNRLNYFKRLLKHRPLDRNELESIYDCEHPHSLAILVPSFCEELRILRMTLMSAALTEYPDRRVILLIDNPPNPPEPAAQKELAATRDLVRELNALFFGQQRKYAAELEAFQARSAAGSPDLRMESRRIARLYRKAAAWLEARAGSYRRHDHYDALYVGKVLLEAAQAHRARAAQFEQSPRNGGPRVTEPLIAREYKRLAALFSVQISSFERKRYVNLSHASNKAMNLNSYLALLGKWLREVVGPGGLHLEECDSKLAQVSVRDADYVITLDADSMLLSDYALQLTHIMSQPESERYAIVQSPFTAVPGSESLLERIAGAQTDVQWFSTQGSTMYKGSFWVGANALLRRTALDDICETVFERGYKIKRYIHDRTLVEDTESTIDLIRRGWQVYCHPERLSYTATPADFGAPVIQRRRWANGPVLILPKLLSYATRGAGRIARLPETILRLYTLTAVLGSASVLFIISVPFPDGRRFPAFLLLACVLPYYWVLGKDLISCGYEWWDLPRVHAMDLLLIPVNLTGLLKSLRQGVTGRRSLFTRTPKVPGRTAAPPVQILMPVFILISILLWTARVMHSGGGFGYGIYGVINAIYLTYGIVFYVRLRFGAQDIFSSAADRIGTWSHFLRFRPTSLTPHGSEAARGGVLEPITSEAAQ